MSSKILELLDAVIENHNQSKMSAAHALDYAIKCGSFLVELKEQVKNNPQTPGWGAWADRNLPFSMRSAREYMLIHNKLRQLPKRQRAAVLENADSVRGVKKMLPDFETPKPPEAPDVPFDADEDLEAEESPQSPKGRQTPAQEPKRQIDRSAWYKQFDSKVSPLVKLVDKIAREVGEMHGPHHRKVKAAMNKMGDEMAAWMQVE